MHWTKIFDSTMLDFIRILILPALGGIFWIIGRQNKTISRIQSLEETKVNKDLINEQITKLRQDFTKMESIMATKDDLYKLEIKILEALK